MQRNFRNLLRAAILCCIPAMGVSAQVDISTWQVNLQHTGANLQETQLTPASITATGGFGLLFTQALDGQSYGQPLFVSSGTLGKFADGTLHNVVYVATEHDSVYAFDADSSTATALWHDSLIPAGTTPVPQGDVGSGDIQVELGITATPVIDTTASILYIVSKVKTTSNGTYQQYLHALDLKTGAEKAGSPVLINPTFVGSSSDSVGGVIPFSALHEHLRSAMALYNGVVYLAYASHSDTNPYHGEILGYNASTLALVKTFITTPSGNEGGFWAGGASPAIDLSGNMFVPVGNGLVSQNSSAGAAGNNWGESMLKLPTNTTGAITIAYNNTLNWFTPNNWNSLNGGDLDVGAGGLLLLPDQTGGSHTHIMVGGGKGSVLYVVDRDNLSGLNNPDGVIQEISDGGAYNFATPAYFNGYLYYAPGGDPLLQRAVGYQAVTGDYISTTPIESTPTYAGKGASAFITANGSTNGLVWILTGGGLHVYNAANVSGQPIYAQYATVPQGPVNCQTPKFALPTVVNGKVYYTGFNASTNQSYLFVDGLLNSGTTPPPIPQAPSNAAAMALTSSTVAVTWTSNSTTEAGFTISRSTTSGGSFQTAGTVGAGVTTFTDTNLTPNTTYFYKVQAYNATGDSSAASTAGVTTFPLDRPTGLVAYLPLDDGNVTTVIDATGDGHNGTVNGEVTYSAAGYINGAYLFHGTGFAASNIVVSNAAALQFSAGQSFSISAYVNPSNIHGAEQAVLAKSADQGNQYGIFINAANQWVFRGPAGDMVGTTAVQGQWTNVAAVQNGTTGTRTLYVNGAVVATGTAQAADGPGDFWIGQQNNASLPDSFPGLIDEVRVYNTALTAEGVSDQLSAPDLGAVSNQTQGSAGTFGLAVYPSPTQVVEAREGSPAGSYSVALTFSAPVTGITPKLLLASGGTAVGTIASATPDSTKKILTLKLANVANAQSILIHLSGIQPGNGTADIPFNVLWGDVNGDGVVSQLDVTADQAQFTSQVTAANYIYDINGDGAVNATDTALITANLGTSLTGGSTPPAKPAITSSLTASGTVGSAFSYQITASGTPTSYSATNLPANLTLNSTTGLITGTPTVAGTSSITLGATNTAGTGTASLALTIAAAVTPPPGTTLYQINSGGPALGTFVADEFFNTGATSQTNATITLAAGDTAPMQVYQTDRYGGSFVYTFSGLTAGASYTVNLHFAETYWTAAGKRVFNVAINGVSELASFDIFASAGGSNIGIVRSFTLNANASGQIVVTFGSGAADLPKVNGLELISNGGGTTVKPAITSALTASGTVGAAFSYQITASGAPTSYSATNLPANLTLNPTTGLITGAPTTAGTSSIALSATNAAGTGTATLALAIAAAVTPPPGTTLYQINSGGPAVGTFVADEFFNTGGTSQTNATITVPAGDAAPMQVYQSERYGGTFAYTFSGLTAGASYTVNLHFAEIYWSAAGKRVFNVAINGVSELSDFDIFATAGGKNIGIVRSFTLNANASGQIVISFTTGTADLPKVSGLELISNGGTVSTPPAPVGPVVTGTPVYQISAGGPAYPPFAAEQFFTAGGTSTSTGLVNTSFVVSPAPELVYQTERNGQSFSFVFPKLIPGNTYLVRLHFAETYFTAVGQRVFNVSINGNTVLTNFDIVKAAGAPNTAVIESFTTTADANGNITVNYFGPTVNQPKASALEIYAQ